MVPSFLDRGGSNSVQLRGFTLIELLVSVSIMAIILGITLSGGPEAIMKLSLSDNVYQTEIMLREAQLQGSAINTKDDTYGGMGVFFDRATSSKVVKFQDRIIPSETVAIGVGDGLFEQAPQTEKESEFSFTRNHRVGKLCVALNGSDFSCNSENLAPISTTIHTLTVSFTRPKQTAHIYINGATTTEYTSACIQIDSLQSPSVGYVQSIRVYHSGMIVKSMGTCK